MVNKIVIMLSCFVFLFFFGCSHKVDVSTKKPITVDVKMRVDVYHHVQKQANYIEDLVNGKKPIPEKNEDNNGSSSLFRIKNAYAQQISKSELTTKMLGAIKSRKERHQKLIKWQSKGILMEDNNGYIKINKSELNKQAEDIKNKINTIAENENNDRRIIYQEIANQNGITPVEVGRQFSYTHKNNAPSGTWIQEKDKTGNWKWEQK